jgi:hypothetical protein
MIKKVIKIIRKIVRSHQNIENQKFIKSAFKIRNALNGNKIGETRYDAKIINLLGGSTVTYTAITKINSYHGCHDIYIYFTGIRSYKIVSGGNVSLSYENTVVQNVVVDGKTYNSADYHTKVDSDRKINVTINYKKKKNLCNNVLNKYS